MYVDSHCHLNYPGLRERVPEVKAAMQAAGVHAALIISTRMEEVDEVKRLAHSHDGWWCTVGVHPDHEEGLEPDVALLEAQADDPKVIGIGETGLDYYRLNGRGLEAMEWQRERFRVHIRAGLRTGKPLVIHTRSASADTLRLIDEEGASGCGGVFHCFTETEAVARAALDRGFYLSFSGIITFKNAADLREVVRWVPLDRLLIETDSPYLAPVPHRGKTNEPAWVTEVARQVAEVRGLTVDEVAAATTDNFKRLFKLS